MMTEDVYLQGRAAQALRALATLGEKVDVRRRHLKEVQRFYVGSSMVLSALSRVPFGDHIYAVVGGWWNTGDRYSTDVSTSRDANFKAQMETNLNKVAEQVRQYVEPGDLADQILIEYEEGDNKHMVLIKGQRAYGARWAADTTITGTQSVAFFKPLQITKMSITKGRNLGEADLLLDRGKSARDDVIQAHRINIIKDMLNAVRVRPVNTSIRAAVGEWSSGVSSDPVLMYNRHSKKWFSIPYRDEGATEVLGRFRDRLEFVRGELRASDLAQYPKYEAANALQLQELRRIGVYAGELSRNYGVGRHDGIALLSEGGGEGYDSFSDRLGMMFGEHIVRVDAAIQAYQGLSGLTSDQTQEMFRRLQSDLDVINRRFQSHVDGSLMQTRGELQIWSVQPTNVEQYNALNIWRDSHKKLSDIASSIAVLRGQLDALVPEKAAVSAREFGYSFMSKKIKIGGKKVNGTMVRMKEKGKGSFYVWQTDVHYCCGRRPPFHYDELS
jgi:hypothetical protein